MRITTKIIGAAASVALVAGGVLATAPAQAAPVVTGPTGDTVITVPMALVQAAATAGVDITAIEPAQANATMDAVGVVFPVTGPAADGAVYHKGGLSLASSVTKITLTLTDPTIEWPTSGDGTSAIIKGIVGGIPTGSGFEQLNGQNATIFDVKNMTLTNTVGKVTKVGKGKKTRWTRTDTQTLTGDVNVVNNPTVVQILNGLLVGPGKTLFTAGMAFGKIDTEWSMKRTCKTLKECKA